jgi:hypothetical protein
VASIVCPQVSTGSKEAREELGLGTTHYLFVRCLVPRSHRSTLGSSDECEVMDKRSQELEAKSGLVQDAANWTREAMHEVDHGVS